TVPAHPLFLAHFALVLILVAYFPYGKLLHAPGVFFSPTRNQADDGRRRLHVNPWDPPQAPPIMDFGRQSEQSTPQAGSSTIGNPKSVTKP
ncbi:MAG: hypothetical protein ACE5FI_14460, partial [Anaerolineales bacterium]